MPDAAGFLRALLDDPDDPSVRLIFADWLDERGDPRGEWLRLQTELAAWVPDLERRSLLQKRQGDWLFRHLPLVVPPELRPWCRLCRYENGLARLELRVSHFLSASFVRNGLDGLRAGWVRTLRLFDVGTRLEELAESPALAGIAGLELVNERLTDADVHRLLASPHLEGLRELNLCGNRLSGPGLRSLVALPGFRDLRRLDVRNNVISNSPLRAFLRDVRRLPLRRLEAHGNPLDPLGRTIDELRSWRAEREPASTRLLNSIGMELALVPAGTFLMGAADGEQGRRRDEAPQHAVTISRPFYIGLFPVTQREHQLVTGRNPSRFDRHNGGGPNHPVEEVDWSMAVEFCRRLSALPAEKAAGRVYRLPTEAEWEHACRAGTTTPFWMGTAPSAHEVNYDGNHPCESEAPKGPYIARTTSVGLYPPNPFGLYDTHGNVWEWVHDWHDRGYYADSPAVDPPGPATGHRRVQRGGSWDCIGLYCRAAHRHGDPPERRDQFTGFRVACSVNEE
jgi:uncharacterized protein (TIGR02996 family)